MKNHKGNEGEQPVGTVRPLETGGEPFRWRSPEEPPFHIAGFAWFAAEGIYRRLPQFPTHSVTEAVESLANHTAGGQIRFQTDSPRLALSVRLKGPASMDHMPATGQCGFDCYLGPLGHQRYLSTTRFDHTRSWYECLMFDLKNSSLRNLTFNFPLYQGVEEVLVGLEPEAKILPPPPYARAGRVIVYGTSITQGGCACRPGMAYTNLLSRRLNVEFINLGFSGSGRGEPEMARNMAEIERPSCFVLDYEANAGAVLLRDTFREFLRILREAHPSVPLLAVSKIRYASELIDAEAVRVRQELKAFQRQVVDNMREQGDGLVFFQDGEALLGEDFEECSVDGAHPTDLGFMRMAEGLAPVLRGILFPGSEG
ncbi:MAG: SGNH/GDSL hydrolase family protein [Armatimonadetes bacterium]|nr:SGNH/GDSL hydrolase family protein [Armatimonadota bacterium]